MKEHEAMAAAEKVIARASAESMTVDQAREYAAELGLTLTPGFLDPITLYVYRGFVFLAEDGRPQKLQARLRGLAEEDRLAIDAIHDATKVDHPAHYNMGGPKGEDGTAKYEAIKVIEDWGLGFKFGNAIKYILRAPHKRNELEDLKKARWYLNRSTNWALYERHSEECTRSMLVNDVCEAWKLPDLLATTVYHVFRGDVRDALVALDAHIASLESKGKG